MTPPSIPNVATAGIVPAECPEIVRLDRGSERGEGGPMEASDPKGASLPLRGAWILDLDGVVWLAGQPIEGVGEAVGLLRGHGVRVVFATNNSAPTLDELIERMRRADIAAEPADIITSAQAAAALVGRGESVLAVADGGAREALLARGARLVDEGPVDAVVVGWTHDFTFDRLTQAADAVRAGARLIGTNEDPTHPTPTGLLPGSGALLAAVVTASGHDAQVAGKPYQPMIDLIRAHHPDVSVVVGDRPSTDGLLARALGAPFALVLSGVTSAGDPVDPPADVTAPDLSALVEGALDHRAVT
jgi:HAD superfamily hydrolase (TIGR01450 family)